MKTQLTQLFPAGSPVDMTDWAYTYRKGASDNPPETDWLWPHQYLKMEVVNGSMVWHYEDSVWEYSQETLLCGYLWEEPRDVKTVTVEFAPSAEGVPTADEIWVACRPVDSMVADCRPWKYDTHLVSLAFEGEKVDSSSGKTIFTYKCDVERLTKLYVIYKGQNTQVQLPVVRVYGAACWNEPLEVEVEWGFQGKATSGVEGHLEVYNGSAAAVRPLQAGNGLAMTGEHQWKEASPAGRRGLCVSLSAANGPANCRTLVTLWTSAGDFSFSVRDLAKGPIIIPSLGFFITPANSGQTAESFLRQLAAAPQHTFRQQIQAHAEQSVAAAMRARYGLQVLPPIPAAPYEPSMKLDVPDETLNAIWKLSAWHLKRWAMKLEDGSYCVSIWPFDKGEHDKVGVDGREGAAALGAESYQILRSLDLLGLHDVAEGGLNYWLYGAHAVPFIWLAEVMGSDSLTNPFNSPNHKSPGYDQKHSGGHGKILHTVAFHYQITANAEWFKAAMPVLERACQAVVRLRRAWMKQLSPEAWGYGLIPPSNTGDGGDNLLLYYMSSLWQAGLQEVAALLKSFDSTSGDALVEEADLFRRDIRRATDRSAALTPVARVRDGSYRRFIPWQPYLRAVGPEVVTGMDGYYMGPLQCGLRLVPEIYAVNEPVIDETMDVNEDVLVSKGIPEQPVDEAWFNQGGINGQPGHEVHPGVYLMHDEVQAYIRNVFNAFAAEIDPFREYVFWEGPAKAGAPDKTFEEAAFLERLRMMLVMEDGNSLWIARATPRAWLEQGKNISITAAPTFFGLLTYTIESDVAHGCIRAHLDLPTRQAPQAVYLRLRHPAAAPIQQVMVNGQPYGQFDREKETISLTGMQGHVEVQVTY